MEKEKMEKIKQTIDKIDISKLSNLQSVIDYCSLHETTGEENYRKLAIDNFRGYNALIKAYNLFIPQIVREFYPLIAEKLGLDEESSREYLDREETGLVDGIAEFLQQLNKTIDNKEIKGWRNYCLRCKTTDSENCKNEREKLVAFQRSEDKGIENIVKDLIKVGKLVAETYI